MTNARKPRTVNGNMSRNLVALTRLSAYSFVAVCVCTGISCRNAGLGTTRNETPVVPVIVESYGDSGVMRESLIRSGDVKALKTQMSAVPGETIAIPIAFTDTSVTTRKSGTSHTMAIRRSDGGDWIGEIRWVRLESHSVLTQPVDDLNKVEPVAIDSGRLCPSLFEMSRTLPWCEARFRYTEQTTEPADPSGYLAYVIVNPQINERPDLIEIGSTTVSMSWVPPAAGDQGESFDWRSGRSRFVEPAPALPTEAFRRQLLLKDSKDGAARGEPKHVRVESSLLDALARRNAFTWLRGIDRLRRASPGVAETLEKLLTRRGQDAMFSFAAWPDDPASMAQLDRLLTQEVAEEIEFDWAMKILSWCDAQPTFVTWIERDHGSSVRVALSNISDTPQTYHVYWTRTPSQSSTLDIPPGATARAVLPYREPSNVDLDHLAIESDDGSVAMLFPHPPVFVLRPPGRIALPSREAWTKSTWLRGTEIPIDSDRMTEIAIEPVGDRWEIRVNCVGPSFDSTDTFEASEFVPIDDGIDPLQNRIPRDEETVSIFFGEYLCPDAIMTISSSGKVHSLHGSVGGETPFVEVGETATGWFAIFDIPAAWISNDSIDLGFIRRYRDTDMVAAWPHAFVPWVPDPGRVRVDLTKWDH